MPIRRHWGRITGYPWKSPNHVGEPKRALAPEHVPREREGRWLKILLDIELRNKILHLTPPLKVFADLPALAGYP